MRKTHELWVDEDGLDMFCLAGPEGNRARSTLTKHATLELRIEAESHFEAMTKYYEHRGYGVFTTKFKQDYIPYK